MTEIDFEELDRAVNSVMISNDDEKPEIETEKKVEDNTSILPTDVKNTIEEKDTEDTKNTVEVEKKAVFKPRQLTKPSGRFMDVFHPSSDMRQKPNMKKDSNESSIASEADKSPKHADMPDPLDVEDKLPDSPFLADAKVEKRPLGAFSEVQAQPFEMNEADKSKYSDLLSGKKIEDTPKKDESAEKQPEEKPETKKADEAPVIDEHDDEPYEAKVEGRNTHLPLELQKDILSVESDPTTSKANISNARSSKTPVALGDPYIHETATELTPQYKEKPSSADQSNGSIYDTKEYHAALLHSAKKKNGWMTIVWIVLIAVVVIGAATGAYLLYFAK